MTTNAHQVAFYTVEIARCNLEREEMKRALINAVEAGTSELENIILFGHQIVELSAKIGTLMTLRATYAKAPPDGDSRDTIPF